MVGVVVKTEVGIIIAYGGMGIMVEAGGPKAHDSNTHPDHRVQAYVMPGVDLSQ